MENSQDKNKQEPQTQTPSLFSLGIPSSLGLSNNPLSYLGSHESKLPQDEQTKTIFSCRNAIVWTAIKWT